MSDGTVRWQAEHEGADGMLATTDVLFVVGPEVVTAFDTSSGSVLWEAEMSDTSGVTPMALVSDVLVVAPDFEEIQAFDPETGASVTYSGSAPTELYADFELPLATPIRMVRWHGTAQRSGQRVRVCRRLVGSVQWRSFNDFETGLSVVSDHGDVLFHSEPMIRFAGSPRWSVGACLLIAEG
jgi:outer membrane protein assembly factor BamB